jgi:hypothetical protein
MVSFRCLGRFFWAVTAIALFIPGVATAQDRDTQEVQRYVLTDAGLAKYTAATKKLAALPGNPAGACNDDGETGSIAAAAAKLEATPGAKAAVTSAGMTAHEYIVFSFSLLQNSLAAWAVSQPGGTLPPGVSQANVDFYKKHAAEIDSLPKSSEGGCDDQAAGDDDSQ